MQTVVEKNGTAMSPPDTGDGVRSYEPHKEMGRAVRRALVAWMMLLATAAFSGLVWMWPVARTLNTQDPPAPAAVHWLGPDFTATATRSLMIVVVLAAVAGSAVQLITVFTLRAGKGTLEQGYESWYLLRPVAAGLVGLVLLFAVHGGVVTIGGSEPADLAVYGLTGALAGLFTDRVVQRLRNLLGATDPNRPASEQEIPT